LSLEEISRSRARARSLPRAACLACGDTFEPQKAWHKLCGPCFSRTGGERPYLTKDMIQALVICPECGAEPGCPCVGPRRQERRSMKPLAPRKSNHTARMQLAHQVYLASELASAPIDGALIP
jgi:hypothetical protein